jgi:ribose 5-phosphate isomerase
MQYSQLDVTIDGADEYVQNHIHVHSDKVECLQG